MIRENRSERRLRASRGQALVPVIFIMIILTTLVVAFALTASRELRAGSNFSAATQRFYAARGAMAYAMSGLAQTSNNGATYGIVPPLPDTDTNGWMPVGDAWVKVDVMDTGGLLNLNSAGMAALQHMPVFQDNPDIVAAIIDWRTPGDQASPNGAKSDYYNALSPPYDCKSAPFDSVDELLLVKGMTPTILFGTPSGNPASPDSSSGVTTTGLGSSPSAGRTRQAAARPGGQTGNTGAAAGSGAAPGTGTGGAGAGAGTGAGGTGTGAAAAVGDTDWSDIYASSPMPLSELFTTVSRERNVAADGTPRVNINTATAQELQEKLGITATLANTLVNFRNSGTNGGQTGGSGSGNSGGTARPGGTGGGNSGGAARPGGAGAGSGGGVAPGGAGAGSAPSSRATRTRTRQALGIQGGQGGGGAPGAGPTGGAGAGGSGAGASGGAGGAGAGGAGGTGAGGTTPVFKTIADLMNVPGRETFDRTVMQSVADHVTVDDQPYHNNLVNINTAPAEVLATVPGMDHATLQAILDYRQGGRAFQSLGDLFSITSLSREQYINVIAHLCTKTSVYRVRIRVKTPGQQGTYAVSALVEMTDNGPRIRQWREVTRDAGWSLWVAPQPLPTPTPPSPAGNPGASLTTGSSQ